MTIKGINNLLPKMLSQFHQFNHKEVKFLIVIKTQIKITLLFHIKAIFKCKTIQHLPFNQS